MESAEIVLRAGNEHSLGSLAPSLSKRFQARITFPEPVVYSLYGVRGMDLICEERYSDSPLVESVWRSRDQAPGHFISMAETQVSLVVTKYRGQTSITLRGPSTAVSPAEVEAGAEYFGIQFRAGVFLPNLPPSLAMQRNELTLPEAGSNSFWLDGSVWEYPDYDNADDFAGRLARRGLLTSDPVVKAVLRAEPVDLSVRTVHRRFLYATGLTYGSLYQIERARYAAARLKQGVPVLDVVYQAGYFDQPHMTRSMKRFIGLTPAQIADKTRPERLSFLYKQESPRFTTIIENRTEVG